MEFIIAQIIGVIGAGLAMVAAQMKDKKNIYYFMQYHMVSS